MRSKFSDMLVEMGVGIMCANNYRNIFEFVDMFFSGYGVQFTELIHGKKNRQPKSSARFSTKVTKSW